MGGGGEGEGMQRQDKRRQETGGKRESEDATILTAIGDDGQCGAGFSRQKAAKKHPKRQVFD